MRATKPQRILERGDYPDSVVFEQHEGIYWLRRDEACLARHATDGTYCGERVGLDKLEASVYAASLMTLGVRVGIRQGDSVRILCPRPPRRRKAVATTPIFLAPESLLDRRELAQLAKGLSSSRCRFRISFEHWHAVLLNQAVLTPSDWPDLYIYELAGGLYEIDWQLTSTSESSFRGLMLACSLLGRKVACLLIAPRRKAKKAAKIASSRKRPDVYGQLRLVL